MVTSGVPTGTLWPGWAWRWAMVPAQGEGTTTTALAVSTSHSGALIWTCWPSVTRQVISCASVRPSPRSGRRKTWSGIRDDPVGCFQDAVHVGEVQLFEAGGRAGDVQPRHPLHRRLQEIEGVVAETGRNLGAKTPKDRRLVDHDCPVGFVQRGE